MQYQKIALLLELGTLLLLPGKENLATGFGSKPCNPNFCTPIHIPARAGNITCTDGNRVESICTITCNPMYEIEGDNMITCLPLPEDTDFECAQHWDTLVVPYCRQLFCGPLEAEIINGNYNCTEGAAEGSICMPYCDEGFVISPHGHEGYQCTNATCSHHSGPGEYICRPLEWEGEPTPECVRPQLFCPEFDYEIINGYYNCTHGSYRGSVCTPICDEGHELLPKDNNEGFLCSDFSEWIGSTPPLCVPILCNNFNDELAFGHYQCDRGTNKGSVCTPVCDRGYEMHPDNHEGYLCNEFAQWIGSPSPQCVPEFCEEFNPELDNGRFVCTRSSYKGSVCEAFCDEGYELAPHEHQGFVCNIFAEWIGLADPECLGILSEFSCDFDRHLCGMQQRNNDRFDWSRGSGQTPSPETGPAYDNTQKNSTGFYLYIEASRPRKKDQYALLATPRFQAGAYCLRFAYHMLGLGVGKLSVLLEDNDNRRELWAETRNRGVLWQQAEFGFTSMDEFRVLFQGSVGRTAAGDIAVDDVNISSGRC